MIGRALALLRGGSGLAAVAQTGIATVLVLAANVATGIVSARWLGPAGRGELAALLIAPQLVSFLFALGLPSALIVRVRQHPERAASLVGAAVLLSASMGALGAGLGYFALPLLLGQYGSDTLRFAGWLLLFAIPGVVSTVLTACLQVRDRFLAFNRIRWWQTALVLVALIALAAAGALDPTTGALAYLVPSVPFFAWSVWWAWREFGWRLADFAASARSLMGYGVRAQGIDVAATLSLQIDKLILIGLLAPAEFGVYVVVFNLSRLVTTFATSVVPVLLPRSAGKPLGEALELASRAVGVASVPTLLAVGAFAAFGVPLLVLLYGPEFAAGYPVLVILAVEAALASAASILQQPYMTADRAGTVALYQVASVLVAAALVYVLAREFAAVGAAAGLLASSALRLWLVHRGFRTLLGVAAPRLSPDWHECRLLAARVRAQLR